MSIRFSKVRVTDNRPAGLGGTHILHHGMGRPLMSGLDHLSESQKREAAAHDKAVRDYSPETVAAAWDDLSARNAWDKKDPEHRWVMARKAALRRLGVAMRERGDA